MTKKIFNLLTASLLVLGVSSCAKEEIGGTAVQDMAGEWYVMVDGVDANGNVTMEDPFGIGYAQLYTYNTNANVPTEMYVDDYWGDIWDFRVIVNVDYTNKTFNVTNGVDDYNGINVNIINGSVVKDGAKSQAGYTADAISFMVAFEDDDYIGQYWDYLWVHGYRRTGLNGGYD